MWPVNKVEIILGKIGFVDSKWSNLIAQGSYNLWFHSLLGPLWGALFTTCREREMLHVDVDGKFIFH